MTATNRTRTKQTETTLATQLVAGFQKHLASVTSLTLGSVVYTPAQIATALQQLVTLYSAVDTAKSAVIGEARCRSSASAGPAQPDGCARVVREAHLQRIA